MKATPVRSIRCAIYTRVSTDQGLDQESVTIERDDGSVRRVRRCD
jgi:hypothetical protein